MNTKKTEHTPGPWRINKVPTSCGQAFKIIDPTQPDDTPHMCIACIYDDHTSLDERSSVEHEANAFLIAKAPDMLSALKAIQHFLRFGEPSKAAKVVEEVLGKIEQS